MKVEIRILLIGVFVGAISYWFQPYNKETVLGVNIYLLMSTGALLGSFFLKVRLDLRPSKIALLVSLGVILSVITRIVFDTTFLDSTSHNLVPFEIIICAAITILPAFAGAYLSPLVKRFIK